MDKEQIMNCKERREWMSKVAELESEIEKLKQQNEYNINYYRHITQRAIDKRNETVNSRAEAWHNILRIIVIFASMCFICMLCGILYSTILQINAEERAFIIGTLLIIAVLYPLYAYSEKLEKEKYLAKNTPSYMED